MQQQSYYSDAQLAERYQVHRATIWRWAVRGDLPQPVQLSPGTTRWRKEQIEEHDAQKQQPEQVARVVEQQGPSRKPPRKARSSRRRTAPRKKSAAR